METLAERLKKLRLQQKRGLTEIAGLLGVSVSTYREWELGREIKGEPYMKLAQIYGVSISYLMTSQDAREEVLHLEKIEEQLRVALEHVRCIRMLL